MRSFSWIRWQRRLLLVVVSVAMLIVGCDRTERKSEGAASNGSASKQASGKETASDDTNADRDEPPAFVRSDSIPDEPKRIVSLAPSVTETLFALGIGDRVVGVTKHCDYPKEATELPKIGSIVNVNFEAILAREPDLVIGVISGGDRDVAERLERAGLSYAFARMTTLEDAFGGIRRFGRVVGRVDRAKELVTGMKQKMDKIAASYGTDQKPRVLMVYGHEPLVAAGPGTFGHQLLVRAGAENVMADAGTQYPRLDGEKLVELSPERIIDTTMANGSDGSFWEAYTMVDAVREGRLVQVKDDVVLRPGPRLPTALETIAEAVHGERDEDSESRQ